MDDILQSRISRFQFIALVFGLVALGLSAFGAFYQPRQFFFSYLFAYIFWLGLSLGCFLVTMIHHLTGGRWGYPTRRIMEAGFLTLPLMLVLLLPIILGLHQLYPWARPAEVSVEKALQHRYPYENTWAYIIRMILFLAIWTWMALRLRKWSLEQDGTPDAAPTRRARALSGPGILIYGLLGTFAAVDCVMSLEKHWYSTIFPVIIMAGQILTAFAFSVIMLALFKDYGPIAKVIHKIHYHQLGNLLLTFVLFWTYVSFGQLLVIYSGDLPHELEWYLHRIAGSWKWVVAALAVLHFFLPFFLLLFRSVKYHVGALTTLACILLLMHMLNTYWLVMPTFHQHGVSASWLDFTVPVGIGGVWLSFVLSRLKSAALLPRHDPGLQFSFVYGH